MSTRSKAGRAALLLVVGIAMLAYGVNLLASHHGSSAVPVAYAQQPGFICPAGDKTKTSALTVTHHTAPSYLGTSTVVEPDVGETWNIALLWENRAQSAWTSEAFTVTVSWNGSQWVLSGAVLPAGVKAIGICQGDTCDAGGGSVHGWTYKLILDVYDPYPGGNHNLKQVVYTTTSVDDGYTIEDPSEVQGNCYLNDAVSPTSQTFSATDGPPYWDSNRCPYNCYTAGASVTIEYD